VGPWEVGRIQVLRAEQCRKCFIHVKYENTLSITRRVPGGYHIMHLSIVRIPSAALCGTRDLFLLFIAGACRGFYTPMWNEFVPPTSQHKLCT